ncbi:MAG: diacylglycerol kinase family lipid kinase [Candidatus Aminicenantes bacterium]|nr:diacylglycerol kinase family lipid kinase [Candidatus Aminicenantes bacterium]
MKRGPEKILLILNPASGFISKDIAVSLILKKLRRHFTSVSLVNTNSPQQAGEVTRQGLKHFDIFTAFGGDGTVNSVAASLINTNKILGILPGGSGNGLARNLKIPLSWLRALHTLISGQDVFIDAGKINNNFFLNVAGMGLDGLISKKFNLESKTRGILPYFYFALKGYLEMPQFKVRVTTATSEFEEDIMLLALANFRQYGAKAVIAPHASPYDRLLDLCILKRSKLIQSSLNIQRLFTGNIHKYPFYKTFKFEQVHIRSLNGPIPFHFDGEYGGNELIDYDINVIPAAIKVRVPAFKK